LHYYETETKPKGNLEDRIIQGDNRLNQQELLSDDGIDGRGMLSAITAHIGGLLVHGEEFFNYLAQGSACDLVGLRT
jgi:hypothetical protein